MAESASEWLTRTWQTDDGLPDNSVTGIEQSDDGHLWVGTGGYAVRWRAV